MPCQWSKANKDLRIRKKVTGSASPNGHGRGALRIKTVKTFYSGLGKKSSPRRRAERKAENTRNKTIS